MNDIRSLFEKHAHEYIKFEREEGVRFKRPDVAAFVRLYELMGGDRDLVCSAENDEIWLDVDIDKLGEVAKEEDIVFLIRCGVRYDSDVDSLAMFV